MADCLHERGGRRGAGEMGWLLRHSRAAVHVKKEAALWPSALQWEAAGVAPFGVYHSGKAFWHTWYRRKHTVFWGQRCTLRGALAGDAVAARLRIVASALRHGGRNVQTGSVLVSRAAPNRRQLLYGVDAGERARRRRRKKKKKKTGWHLSSLLASDVPICFSGRCMCCTKKEKGIAISFTCRQAGEGGQPPGITVSGQPIISTLKSCGRRPAAEETQPLILPASLLALPALCGCLYSASES